MMAECHGVSRVEIKVWDENFTKARANTFFERPSQRGGVFYPAGFPSLAQRVHGLKQHLLLLFSFSTGLSDPHGPVGQWHFRAERRRVGTVGD
jgi:hypothetical protein